jgi:AcrR family transcriptional regulator
VRVNPSSSLPHRRPRPARADAPAAGSAHVQEKHRRRRREILHSALRAFRERGYHDTTLDAIAERLGVRRTALYHYFADKEAILHAGHLEALGELQRIVREARRLRGPAERLRHLIREHVRVMTETLEGSPLAIEVTAFSPEHRSGIVAARDRYERALRGIIADGVKSGVFRPADPKIAAFVVLGAINWIVRWYHPGGGFDAAQLGHLFADLLVGGLVATTP